VLKMWVVRTIVFVGEGNVMSMCLYMCMYVLVCQGVCVCVCVCVYVIQSRRAVRDE